jgi:hypothetical protein
MTTDPPERLDMLVAQGQNRLARIFRTAIEGLRDELDMDRVAELLARQDYEALANMLMQVAEELGAASNVIFANAGQSTAQFLAGAGVATIAYDQVNTRAVANMQANRLRLIREFQNQQRRVIREVMVEAMQQGLHPTAQARRFREVVGLTRKQTRAVTNYRRLLEGEDGVPSSEALQRALRDRRSDTAVRAAIRAKRPLSPEHIDRMVARYHKRFIAYRAVTIARTEALRSVHQGVEEAYSQAIASGKISAQQIVQKWVSAGDGRVRDSHANLNGEERPWGEPWQGSYGTLRYPGDPEAPAAEVINCRCAVTRRIKPAQQAVLPL